MFFIPVAIYPSFLFIYGFRIPSSINPYSLPIFTVVVNDAVVADWQISKYYYGFFLIDCSVHFVVNVWRF